MLNKHITIEYPTLSLPHVQITYPTSYIPYIDDMVINIQLPYDLNAPTEPELWKRNFHPISLHSSIEYLASDSKNIKDSLNFIAKYISNKQVDSSKSNDLEDFNGIGEAIWNFISFIYQSKWDSLITDKNSNTLRQKILVKFTPKVPSVPNRSNKFTNKPILASIKKISFLFLPNCRRRLTKSPNTSKIPNWPMSLNSLKNLMCRPQNKVPIHPRLSKSKMLFYLLVQKKLTKSRTLSMAILRQSYTFK